MPKVSLVMTAYKRAPQLATTLRGLSTQTFQDFEVIVVEDGDDGGLTRTVCAMYPKVRYFQRQRRPDVIYSNPAVPSNIGLRAATGEILVFCNAECCFKNDDGLETLVNKVTATNVVFATVYAEGQAGTFDIYYCHPVQRPEPWFFCGAMQLHHMQAIRGLDEEFTGYGHDDVDLALRLKHIGLTFEWTGDVIVRHQWHDRVDCIAAGTNEMNALYHKKRVQLEKGEITAVRNTEEWGLQL